MAKELSLAAPMHGGLLCHLKTTTVPLALEQLPLVESQPPWKNTDCFSAILPGTGTTAPVCNLECPREPMQADPAGGDLQRASTSVLQDENWSFSDFASVTKKHECKHP